MQDRAQCQARAYPPGQPAEGHHPLHPAAHGRRLGTAQWAGVTLVGTSVYGIRRYNDGAWLAAHVDQMATHVISAILNIGQQGDPWPLHILDHEDRQHQILLKQGQMVWYESAKLQHARPVRFRGEFFDNVFVHFKPRDRRWYSKDIMQVGWQYWTMRCMGLCFRYTGRKMRFLRREFTLKLTRWAKKTLR